MARALNYSSCYTHAYDSGIALLHTAFLGMALLCTTFLCMTALCSCSQDESTSSASSSSIAVTSSNASSNASHDASYDERFNDLMVDGKKVHDATKRALSNQHVLYASKVQPEYQFPELPSGCEVVSLTIVLRAAGFELSKTEIADNYLVVNGSEWGFLTSPYEYNGGGFPPGIVDAANSYLAEQDTLLEAHDLTGSSFDAICALVDTGIPVCVWTTLDFNEPNYDYALGATETWFVNEHCVVLYGILGSEVLLANPLEGVQTVDAAQFARTYEQCGNMALAVY